MKRWLKFSCLLCILAVTAAAFSPALENGFTSWDDDIYLTDNPQVRKISWENAGDIFTSFVSGNYHPLAFLTYSWEYHFFGPEPRVYHVTNLALHLLAAALVFWLLLRLSGGLPAAAAGTLLFALHPLRVETVAWVADRKDLLTAVFFLGALIAYLHYRRERKRWSYLLSFLLFLFSLFAKATAVTFPLVLLLCDFLMGRVERKDLFEKIPFFTASAAFGIIAIIARGSYQGVLLEQSYGFSQTAFVGAHKLVLYYLARTVVPVGGIFHLYPSLDSGGNLLSPVFMMLLAVIGVLGTAVFFSLRHTRKIAFGALFFLVNLFPALTVVVVGYSADRFSYLASVGVAYLAGELFLWCWTRRYGRTAAGRGSLLLVLTLLSSALISLTWKQCGVWRNSITLWTHAIENYSGTSAFAQNRAYAFYNRGLAYREAGDLDRALGDLKQAVALYPGRVESLVTRGYLYVAREEPRKAVSDFTRALEIDPGNVVAHNERGILYNEAGAYDQAVSDFTRALEIDPGNAAVSINLGITLLNQGENDRANRRFTRALEIDPSSAAAYYGRAQALSARREDRRAWADLLRAEDLGYAVDPLFRSSLQKRVGSPHEDQ